MRNFLVIAASGNLVTTEGRQASSKIISLNAERIEDDTMEHTGGIFLHTKAQSIHYMRVLNTNITVLASL